MIFFHIKVKFRAFGITFGTLDEKPRVDVGLPVPVPPFDQVVLDKRGVYVRVSSKMIP